MTVLSRLMCLALMLGGIIHASIEIRAGNLLTAIVALLMYFATLVFFAMFTSTIHWALTLSNEGRDGGL